MDKEKLKEILEEYWFDNQYLKEKSDELERMRNQTYVILDRYNELHDKHMDTRGLETQLSAIINAHVDEEQRLINLLKKKRFIEDLIQTLPQPYKTLFYFKYIVFLNFDEVSKKMNFSSKRLYQLHNEGLEKLLEFLNQLNIQY